MAFTYFESLEDVVKAVRDAMIDHPNEDNIKFDGVEFNDTDIKRAVDRVSMYLNSRYPHMPNMNWSNVPSHFIVRLTISELLNSRGLQMLRNESSIEVNGVQKKSMGNTYISLADNIKREVYPLMVDWTMTVQYMQFYGGF